MQHDNLRWRVFAHALTKANLADRAIVEIGLMRDPNGRLGDGHSTLFWKEYLDQAPTTVFYGIDINPDAVIFAAAHCEGRSNMHFLTEDGVAGLTFVEQTIGLIYLDSSDDPRDTLNQFVAALPKLAPDAVVVIDDVGGPEREDHMKGHLLIPVLEATGWILEWMEDYMLVAYRTCVL